MLNQGMNVKIIAIFRSNLDSQGMKKLLHRLHIIYIQLQEMFEDREGCRSDKGTSVRDLQMR